MFGITDLSTYIIGTVAIILLPGPNSMFCLAVAGQYGAAIAYRAVAAIFIGDGLLMLATALGAASFLKANPQWFDALRLAGALYLAYIGINLLLGAYHHWQQTPKPAKLSTKVRARRVFAKALTLSLMNPKAILFFLSFFVQFVDPNYPQPYLSFLLLALILQAISMIYLSVLIFAGVRLVRAFAKHHRVGAGGMGAIGTLFMGFAAKLWQASI